MKHLLYKLTDPNGKSYYGVTNNFKRRMKEHRRSDWDIGKALRHFGEANFTMSFEEFETREDAFEKEFELVSPSTVGELYNMSVGGDAHKQMLHSNPMKDPLIAENHPNMWSTVNNPMNSSASKQKMIQNQKRKAVSIDGFCYNGVREAARAVGESRQLVVYRLKSPNTPTWFYL